METEPMTQNQSDDVILQHLANVSTAVRGLTTEVANVNEEMEKESKSRIRLTIATIVGVFVALALGVGLWVAVHVYDDTRRDADIAACERGNDFREGIREFVFTLAGEPPVDPGLEATPEERERYLERLAEHEFIIALTNEKFGDQDCEAVVE